MNIIMIIFSLLGAVISLVSAVANPLFSGFLVTSPRRFPGERRLGRTNYGQYSFGANGYEANRNPRKRFGRRSGYHG